jgi:transcriptional regulator with XRE-family HTH domain
MSDILTNVSSALQKASDRELRRIAEGSGVSYPTLNKIRYGYTKNPGVLTVQAIADFTFGLLRRLMPE